MLLTDGLRGAIAGSVITYAANGMASRCWRGQPRSWKAKIEILGLDGADASQW